MKIDHGRAAAMIALLGWIWTAWAPSAARAAEPLTEPLRIIVFGAHPDDAEFKAGGTALLWARAGHKVKMVSVTNGDIGHWSMDRAELAARRAREAKNADGLLGAQSEVFDIHDGELEPTLEVRRRVTRAIRKWRADIVISHRPWDYHPDHRYVGVLAQDAAFMVTVPNFCPDTPALTKNPVFLYSSDGFTKPEPFRPDIAVAIDEVLEDKVAALHELESQVYEGGALGNAEYVRGVPPASDPPARKAWLLEKWRARQAGEATRFREALIDGYGKEFGQRVRYAEAFELCEYGRRPTLQELRAMFPFVRPPR